MPLRHARALFGHVVPTVIALRTNILQDMILQAISNLFWNARLAGQCFPRAPKITIRHNGDSPTIPLPPHEAVERARADRLRRVFCGWEEPAEFVRHDRLDEFGGDRRDWDRMRFSILRLGPVDDPFLGVPLVGMQP